MYFLKRQQANALVGIEFSSDGIAVATKLNTADKTDVFKSICFLNCDTEEENQQDQLMDFVKTQGLLKATCNVVLPSDAYQLSLLETPDVPDAELRDAIRWRLKDLLDIPLEEAAIDVFPLPQDGTRSGKPMSYVVSAQLSYIKKIIDLINQAGLKLNAIDIAELALRNVAQWCDHGERGVAVVRILPGRGSVVLYRCGNMYLSRQFELDYDGGLLDDLPEEHLTLEIQRSLDYYERQMGQVPPAALYLCGTNVLADKITENIRQSLAVPVKHLSLDGILNTEQELDTGILQLCLGALGGTLREDKAA